jgi:hypothetical protein
VLICSTAERWKGNRAGYRQSQSERCAPEGDLKLIRDLRKKRLATTTVRGIIRTLSACLSVVVDDEDLDANPAQSLRKHLRKREDEVHEPDPLTSEELQQLLETARVHVPASTPYRVCATDAAGNTACTASPEKKRGGAS